MVRHSDMTPNEAWVAATSSAAALCGVSDRLGKIAPGYLADITVLDGDFTHLEDLRTRVWGVWKDGVRVV